MRLLAVSLAPDEDIGMASAAGQHVEQHRDVERARHAEAQRSCPRGFCTVMEEMRLMRTQGKCNT